MEDLSIQGKLSSNSFDVVMVYMLYVKDHPGFISKPADQKPKQSETHSSTFPQDSDSDSESEIELISSQSTPGETTSEELDGTLVDTSTPSSAHYRLGRSSERRSRAWSCNHLVEDGLPKRVQLD